MHEALYYQPQAGGLRCRLCPKACLIGEGRAGFCRVRRNEDGVLYADNYAACSACALDPIEKKPLYHFYPGSFVLSLGSWGCNFACRFCQNWQIAQRNPTTTALPPEQAVELALQYRPQGNIGIAYTYSEPGVWYEYVLDTARVAQAAGLKNILVTNGFINLAPLEELLPYIDALNIDVKAFTEECYSDMCAGGLSAVQATVETAVRRCHVEITTLLIPGVNDSPSEIQSLAQWLAGLDPEIPLHFSRYFPSFQLQLPATPLAVLEQARQLAGQYLAYVYLGNLEGSGVNTYCPACGQLVLDRQNAAAYLTPEHGCRRCDRSIPLQGEVYWTAGAKQAEP